MIRSMAITAAIGTALLATPVSAATSIVSTGASTTNSQWTVTTPSGATSTANVIAPVPGWSAPLPGSQWLQSAPNPAPSGTYIFTHVFNLANIGNVQSVLLRWLADNQVVRVTVNGTTLFNLTPNNSVSQFSGAAQTFSASLASAPFVNGSNTMQWFVYNRPLSGTNNGGLSAVTTITTVPEPGTWLLMILGLGAVGFAMRRRQNASVRLQFA